MTGMSKDELEKLSNDELYRVLLKALRKIEAQLLMERSLRKIPAPQVASALAKVRDALKLTKQIIERK